MITSMRQKAVLYIKISELTIQVYIYIYTLPDTTMPRDPTVIASVTVGKM